MSSVRKFKPIVLDPISRTPTPSLSSVDPAVSPSPDVYSQNRLTPLNVGPSPSPVSFNKHTPLSSPLPADIVEEEVLPNVIATNLNRPAGLRAAKTNKYLETPETPYLGTRRIAIAKNTELKDEDEDLTQSKHNKHKNTIPEPDLESSKENKVSNKKSNVGNVAEINQLLRSADKKVISSIRRSKDDSSLPDKLNEVKLNPIQPKRPQTAGMFRGGRTESVQNQVLKNNSWTTPKK